MNGLSKTPDVFRAFADATRLRILNLLIEGELCVCDLCAVLDEIQPKVSRHLAYLRSAGLVSVRRQGKWKFYALADDAAAVQRSLLGCVRTCLRELDELRDDLVRLRALPDRRACA